MRLQVVIACIATLVGSSSPCWAATEPEPANSATNAERLYAPEELQADLEELYRRLQSAHFDLYAFAPKPELDRRYQEALEGLVDPLTLLQARTRLQLFTATVRMGHTRVESPVSDWQAYRQDGGTGFPLTIRVVGDRVFVAENLSGVERIRTGDEIIALNGQPMAHWLARTARHISAETTYMAHSVLEYDFAIYLWIELGSVSNYDLVLRGPGADSHEVRVPARSRAEMDTVRALQPPVLDLTAPLREAKILREGVGYLRPGPFYNAEASSEADAWDVSGFQRFIDAAFNSFAEAHVDCLILDLRGNPGGDNLFSDVLVSWIAARPFRFASSFKVKISVESIAANDARIAHDAAAAGPISQQYAKLYASARIGDIVDFDIPLAHPRPEQRFDGQVFVLVDRQSYSNAVAVAALIQDYGFGVILGEPTSDMATTYGAMERFRLPHTGLLVGYPKARIVRPSGDPSAQGVTPNIAIAIPVVQDPSDPVLAQAAAIAMSAASCTTLDPTP